MGGVAREFPAVALRMRVLPAMEPEQLQNFIGGEFVACTRHLDSYNPATGEIHLLVPDSGEEEVEEAVQAALTAFKT